MMYPQPTPSTFASAGLPLQKPRKGVLITGAAGGIGLASARFLAEKGYGVVGMGRRLDDATRAEFDRMGAVFCPGDVTNAADRRAAVDAVLAHFGRLYALVNVAGVAPKVRTDLLEMTEESYDAVMDINLKGTLFLTQLAANAMLANPLENGLRGAVVNISSISAYTSSIKRGEYCISKAGLSMLTKLFADRLAPEGILVNEIRPGIIATGMTAAVQQKYDALIEGGLLPIARWGQPEDVARAVLALVDGTFPYTTGQSFDVDGGFHIRRL